MGPDVYGSLFHYWGTRTDRRVDGKTYPQEGPLDYEAFAGYFFGAATIVGIVSEGEGKKTLEEAIEGRELEECVGGCYYMYARPPDPASLR